MAFYSKYDPKTAERLNKLYEEDKKYYNDVVENNNNILKERQKCLDEAEKTTDLIERMQKFDKCNEKKIKYIQWKGDDFFFNKHFPTPDRFICYYKHQSFWFDNFRDNEKKLGILDSYYMANEKIIDDAIKINGNKDIERCRQKGVLQRTETVDKCICKFLNNILYK